jgi:hypothetical protein
MTQVGGQPFILACRHKFLGERREKNFTTIDNATHAILLDAPPLNLLNDTTVGCF